MPMEFSGETARNYAAAISRPRLVGTPEEKAVAHELTRQLEAMGYRVEAQPFRFWIAPIFVLHALVLAGIVFALLGITGAAPYWIAAAGMAVTFAAFPALSKRAESAALLADAQHDSLFIRILRRLGAVYETSNLVGTLPNQEPDCALPHLYLVGHYDTKSQPLPIAVRAILFMTLLASCIVFIVSGTLAGLAGFVSAVAFLSGLLIVLAAVPLFFNGHGNASPGAVDNASAVAVAVHAAEILAQSTDLAKHLRWTVLLTGAEELTLMGAAAFTRRLAQDPSALKNAHLLNFDGVGVDGRLHYDARGGTTPVGDLVRVTQEAASAKGIAIVPFKLFGALFDHIPFRRAGFDTLTILTVGKASRSIHTKHDGVHLLDAQRFQTVGDLTMEIARRLARAE